jgi:hypothetical protein
MEVKPTFFSLSGFLAPGIVLVGSITLLLGFHYRSHLSLLIQELSELPKNDAALVVLGTLLIAALLAVTFALGAVLSDTFMFVGRLLLEECFKKSFHLKKKVSKLRDYKTLEELIFAEEVNVRETYVYMQTCGLDLHWYAGRIRMMGSTGLALLIATVVAIVLSFPYSVIFCLFTVAFWALAVALFRLYGFDEYVAAAAVAIVRRNNTKDITKQPDTI